jgi:hypothetical protein
VFIAVLRVCPGIVLPNKSGSTSIGARALKKYFQPCRERLLFFSFRAINTGQWRAAVFIAARFAFEARLAFARWPWAHATG